KNKKIKAEDEINKDYLIKKGLIRKKCDKLKILGKGDLKNKLKINTDFISKSAQSKIEKSGGTVIISKNKVNIGKKNV
ncbi:MAG: uL15 family ribosomal protein, partial [Pelagibacteraceae bacterium]|nr:uL15 family ribosomal protein [Pelagibacteraceae bacterium]